MNILERIFSVKNEYNNIFKTKIFTILGVKIKFKSICKERLKETIDAHYKQINLQIKAQKLEINDLKMRYKDLKERNETQYKLFNIISSPSKLPKAKGELRECQLKILETMKAVKKICNENSLTYWLDGGSFLGAVRHKGIIPWDCDADICMPREDYLKIIPLLKKYFENTDTQVREYYIFKNGQANYQICLCNKESLDVWQPGGGRRNWGVDIFPIDKYCESDISEDKQKEVHLKILEATKILQDKFKTDRDFAKKPEEVRKYIVELEKEYILENNPVCIDRPALYTGIDYAWESPTYFIINWDKVFPLKTINFEGEEFNCPNDIDYYLTNYYRKYMYFPPKFKPGDDKIDEYVSSLTEAEH